MNACRKGKRIEREAAKFLTELGFGAACRGQQHRGSCDAPDVICDGLGPVHLEVKGDEAIDLGTKALTDACQQAREDAGENRSWAVLWRRKRRGWRLTYETFSGRKTRDTAEGIRSTLVGLGAKMATPGGIAGDSDAD